MHIVRMLNCVCMSVVAYFYTDKRVFVRDFDIDAGVVTRDKEVTRDARVVGISKVDAGNLIAAYKATRWACALIAYDELSDASRAAILEEVNELRWSDFGRGNGLSYLSDDSAAAMIALSNQQGCSHELSSIAKPKVITEGNFAIAPIIFLIIAPLHGLWSAMYYLVKSLND